MSKISIVLKSAVYHRACCLALFFVAAAASFNGYYDKWQFREYGSSGYKQGLTFDGMLDGTAARPYVYRQLLPIVANWIDRQVPERTKDLLFSISVPVKPQFEAGYRNSPLVQNRKYNLRYLIVYGIVFLFAWAATIAMYLVGKEVGFEPTTAALSAVAMILLIPYFQSIGGYFYDYPDLAFMAIAFWMALKVDWWWIVPVAALATLNKESFLFFALTLYPLLRLRAPRFVAVIGNGVILLTCAAVYLTVKLHFQHNPGSTVEFHLTYQLIYVITPMAQELTEKTYGLYFLSGLSIFWCIVISWVVWSGWRYLPPAIRRHAKLAAAINFPLYLLFGFPGEMRGLNLLYITFLLIIAANLSAWAGDQGKTPIPESGQSRAQSSAEFAPQGAGSEKHSARSSAAQRWSRGRKRDRPVER